MPATPTEDGYKAYTGPGARPAPVTVVVEDLASGELTDLNRTEDDAFWAWAVIETLRHTGVRIEDCWSSPKWR